MKQGQEKRHQDYPLGGLMSPLVVALIAFLVAFLLSGCVTIVLSSETDKQIGQTGKGIAETILKEGCSPGDAKATINLDCAKHHERKLGVPKYPTPVNTRTSDAGDVETTKRLCKRSEEEDERRLGWIWKVVGGVVGGGAVGGGALMFIKRFLGGGGAGKLLDTLVDAGELIKKKLPKAQQNKVGDGIREAAAKHGTAGPVQDKFVDKVKNGGATT